MVAFQRNIHAHLRMCHHFTPMRSYHMCITPASRFQLWCLTLLTILRYRATFVGVSLPRFGRVGEGRSGVCFLLDHLCMVEIGCQKTDLVRIFFLLQKKTLYPFCHLERIIEMGLRKNDFFLNKLSFMKSFFWFSLFLKLERIWPCNRSVIKGPSCAGSGLDREDDPGSHESVNQDQSRNAVGPLDLSNHPQETHYLFGFIIQLSPFTNFLSNVIHFWAY
jgi:hypothetical protein